MRFFKLPDLGEGLQEAEIIEWLVKPGDSVEVDQAMVVVETAKAMVEIPSPQQGVIAQCFGEVGGFVYINEPLVEYQGEEDSDSGTVVGKITEQESDDTAEDEDFFIIGSADNNPTAAPQAALGQPNRQTTITEKSLRGARRAMAKSINASRVHSASVTICEDADVHHWTGQTDITIQLCRAIVHAIQKQPLMNAWFDEESLVLDPQRQIDLALAVDTDQGLFAPVLRDIADRDDTSLRNGLNDLRKAVEERKVPPQELRGATITLSNFGTLGRKYDIPKSGRYATPMIVPPSVAIIGSGAIREAAVVHRGNIEARRIMPLSVTFDHRVITGAEASIFLGELIKHLEGA